MYVEQFVAEEVRLLLAELGFKSLDEAIGRADVLAARTDVPLAKTNGMLDLDFITKLPDVSQDRCRLWGYACVCVCVSVSF